MSSLRAPGLALALLTLAAGYALHVFGHNNGFFSQVDHLSRNKLLPTPATAPQLTFPESFTGWRPLDQLLDSLLVIFWPLVDGQNLTASLISFLFAGQALAAWSVALMEGSRKGNQGRLISHTTIFGMLVQALGGAFVCPVYLLVYLRTSPLAKSTAQVRPTDLFIDDGTLRSYPIGLFFGYILPTLLMALPYPSLLSFKNKVWAVIVWQFFPLWVALFSALWNCLLRTPSTHQSQTPRGQLRLQGKLYRFSLTVSVSMHLVFLAITLASLFLPGIFPPTLRGQLAPRKVLLPASPFSSVVVDDVAEGALWFIQYDFIISAIAYVVWALAMKNVSTVGSPNTEKLTTRAVLGVLCKCVLIGPMSTAMTLMRDRDIEILSPEHA